MTFRIPKKLRRSLNPKLVALNILVASIVGGSVGVALVLAMLWLSYRNWMLDQSDKHGISEEKASRLGGVVIFLSMLAYLFVAPLFGDVGPGVPGTVAGQTARAYFSGYEWAALLLALIGLWDDYSARASASTRLALTFSILGVALYTNPYLLPLNLDFPGVPAVLQTAPIIGAVSLILVVGFVNAGNMADGANGLLSVIATIFFLVAYLESQSLLYAVMLIATLGFALFNVSTGLIFLGDFGSYGLSALIGLGSLELYSQGNHSAWFFGCLLGYPCVEIVRVIALRLSVGLSPLAADNNHLHNLIFEELVQRGWHRLPANSLTGVGLAIISAAPPLLAYLAGAINPQSWEWAALFLMYAGLHVLVAQVLQGKLRAYTAKG